MRKTKILKILTILLFQNFLFSDTFSDTVPKKDKIALMIIDETSLEMGKKYPISQIGFGINQGFEYFEISFQLFKNFSKSSLRLILFDCVSTFLEKINSSDEIRPYLSKFPLAEQDIGIILFLRSEENEDLFEPDFCCATFRRGEFNYHTKSKSDRYIYKDTFTETFDEALKLLKNQAISTQRENP